MPEIILQAARLLGVGAATSFADISLPLLPMGVQLEVTAGDGPIIRHPSRAARDLTPLRVPTEVGRGLSVIDFQARMATRIALIPRDLRPLIVPGILFRATRWAFCRLR